RSRAEKPAAHYVRAERVCRGRGPYGLFGGFFGFVPPNRHLRRQDPQGRQACRPSRRAADEMGVRDQPKDREGSWHHDPAVSAGAGGPSDPVMDRRVFITVVGRSILAAPLAPQTPESTPRTRVAFLGAESRSTNQHFLDAFRHGLREHGYVDGQNLTLEERWADGRSERFPGLIGELVRLKASVIMTVSTPAALAAKNATTTIPIVFIAVDPLGSGLVPSLARPGGNLTGLSISLGEDFSGKWLELLKEAVPKISRVAVLNPANPANTAYLTVLRSVAQKLGVKLQSEE